MRSDDLARTAPGREAVEDNELVLVLLHGLVELSLGGEVVDALLAHCGGEETGSVGEDRSIDRGVLLWLSGESRGCEQCSAESCRCGGHQQLYSMQWCVGGVRCRYLRWLIMKRARERSDVSSGCLCNAMAWVSALATPTWTLADQL